MKALLHTLGETESLRLAGEGELQAAMNGLGLECLPYANRLRASKEDMTGFRLFRSCIEGRAHTVTEFGVKSVLLPRRTQDMLLSAFPSELL